MAPELSRVQGTDAAEIGIFEDGFTDRTIVVCAIDNLGKGAAGQAVQNVNHLYGWEETTGLRVEGVLV
jgi:N-acetyl-gamma-glutamyl-phosphate reductase